MESRFEFSLGRMRCGGSVLQISLRTYLADPVSAAPLGARAADTLALGGSARAGQAYAIRLSVTQGALQVAKHPDNGEETAYATRIGSPQLVHSRV